MKPLEECVVTAMDGSDKALFPFLPYLLQDAWEIGTDPGTVIRMINRHCKNNGKLRVLDLGCGKGAVSVNIAAELGCFCHGIDAIPEFIDFAAKKAIEYNVGHLCLFETADIREQISHLSGYDVVILGAIGPVFGNYYQTLKTLSRCISENGIVVVDDGYIEDSSGFSHPMMLKESDIRNQITGAGMKLLEIEVMDNCDVRNSAGFIYEHLRNRCYELIGQYPDRQHLFLDYLKKQEEENDVLENMVTASTLVIRKVQGNNDGDGLTS